MDECFSFRISVDGLHLLTNPGLDPADAASADIVLVHPIHDESYFEALIEYAQPKLIIPIHWDDLFRPLTQPLRPYYNLPNWSFPPFQRINLSTYADRIDRISENTRIFMPEAFEVYNLMDYV